MGFGTWLRICIKFSVSCFEWVESVVRMIWEVKKLERMENSLLAEISLCSASCREVATKKTTL